MEESGLATLCQKGNYISPKQKAPKKLEIFQAPSYKTQKKSSPQKNNFWVGGGGGRGDIPWEIRIQIQTTRNLLG